MRIYLHHIKALFYKLAIVALLFSLSRLFFFVLNRSYFSDEGFGELLQVFLGGIRFDVSSIVFYNFLFILLFILPFPFISSRWYQKTLTIAFWLINSLLLLTNFVDAEYFKFTSKRTTFEFFKVAFIGDDTLHMLPRFISDYWYIVLAWILSMLVGWCLLGRTYITKSQTDTKPLSFKYWLMSLSIFLLTVSSLFITARGIEYKPLRLISAAGYTSSKNIPLLLSTPFTLMHTYGSRSLKLEEYMPDKEAVELFNPIKNTTAKRTLNKQNVVVFILESFSNQFIGTLSENKGYTPFLDSLMAHSLVFENGFANGRRSIEAMPFIFSGFPGMQENPHISSEFSSNQLTSLPDLLRSEGYQTAFFHGGRNGTMGFDAFAHLAGFNNYYGLNEFGKGPGFDGSWGISDYEFMQFMSDQLNGLKQPFMAGVFTLTSHHPFKVPADYEGKFPQGPHPIYATIAYTDYSLRAFFDKAKHSDWFNNTLFVFVADHTGPDGKDQYATRTGMYRIPIVFYHPAGTLPAKRSNKVAQQADIMETVLDYLGYTKPFVSFGNSLLNDSANRFSISFAGGMYQFIQQHYTLTFDGSKSLYLYDWLNDPLEQHNLVTDSLALTHRMEQQLKAVIQQYNQRMIFNNMIVKN